MIHILRKNETTNDICNIYGIREDELLRENPHTVFAENSAVYIPSAREIYFTKNECNAKSLSEKLGIDEDIFCETNHIKKGNIIPANMRVLGRETTPDRKLFSAVFAVKSVNADFVNADRKAHLYSRIFVDCYKSDGDNINLPEDYPALNACRINGISAGIYINDISSFCNEEVLLKIKQDLKYKDYGEVLLNVPAPSYIDSLGYITDFFLDAGMKVSIISDESVLRKLDYSHYDTLYYSSKRNIFDFASFTAVMDALTEAVPAGIIGYHLKMCAADIKRDTMKINYPHISHIRDLYEKTKAQISYDIDSKLCFFSDTSQNRNYIYEDYRTIYAKCAYLSQKGISKFITTEPDEAMVRCAWDGFNK